MRIISDIHPHHPWQTQSYIFLYSQRSLPQDSSHIEKNKQLWFYVDLLALLEDRSSSNQTGIPWSGIRISSVLSLEKVLPASCQGSHSIRPVEHDGFVINIVQPGEPDWRMTNLNLYTDLPQCCYYRLIPSSQFLDLVIFQLISGAMNHYFPFC